MVEIALFAGDVPVVSPRLRNGYHNGKRKLKPVHDKEFKRVVKHCRVGTRSIDDGKYLVHVLVAENAALHCLLTGKHTVNVSADRVYLAVVEDEAVGVGALPARCRVRRETGMNGGNGTGIIRVAQVGIERAELTDKEHSLVDNGARRERRNIGVVVALLEHPADKIQPSVKIKSPVHALRSAEKALHYIGHTFPCAFAEDIALNRYIAPAEEGNTLLCRDYFEHFLRLTALQRVLREEEHSDAVIAFAADYDPQLRRLLCEKCVRYLGEYADSVAGLAVGVFSCAVLELFNYRKRAVNCFAALFSVYADNGADTAGIMFGIFCEKSLFGCNHDMDSFPAPANTGCGLSYRLSSSFIHTANDASDGIRRSPRGESVTVPTFGPSGIQERLNCWMKKRLTNVFSQ